jgi:hypothetical protein
VKVHARPTTRLNPRSIVAEGASALVLRLHSSVLAVSVTAAAVALLAYLSAIAPDITWANHSGDGGELITASYTLGVAHPPGYPLYVVLGKAFSTLPVGTIAFRYNLLSAISLATTAGLVAATVTRSSPRALSPRSLNRTVTGLATGLTVAFAPLIWGQALVAEVYALNLAFLAAFLLALTFCRGRAHFLAGVFLGLGCVSHLTSLLMAPLGLAVIPRRSWPKLALGFLVGLLPLLLLPLLGKSGSPIIWGRPDTLPGWWWLISANLYRTNVFSMAPTHLVPRLSRWAPILAANVLVLALPIALLSAGGGNREQPGTHRGAPDPLQPFATAKAKLGLLAIALLYTIFATFYAAVDAEVLLLPAILALGVLLGLQIARFGRITRFGRIGRNGLAALLLPAGLLLLNLQTQDLSLEDTVRLAAARLLEEVPPEALILTPGDQSYAALSYMLEVEGQRPDLVLVDANLFQFDWYRQRLNSDIAVLKELQGDDLRAFVSQSLNWRPVCVVSLLPSADNHCFSLSR